MEIAWVGLTVFSVLSLRRGLEFRRGSNRGLLGLYRSTTSPIVYRQLPLVLPFVSGAVLILLIAAALFAGLGPAHPTTRAFTVEGVLAFAGLLFMFFTFSISIALMYWPPRWLIPAWLRDDDERVGFKRPKPGWLDRFWLLVGLSPAVVAWYLVEIAIDLANGGSSR